jgi:hypothetical protein
MLAMPATNFLPHRCGHGTGRAYGRAGRESREPQAGFLQPPRPLEGRTGAD